MNKTYSITPKYKKERGKGKICTATAVTETMSFCCHARCSMVKQDSCKPLLLCLRESYAHDLELAKLNECTSEDVFC